MCVFTPVLPCAMNLAVSSGRFTGFRFEQANKGGQVVIAALGADIRQLQLGILQQALGLIQAQGGHIIVHGFAGSVLKAAAQRLGRDGKLIRQRLQRKLTIGNVLP